ATHSHARLSSNTGGSRETCTERCEARCSGIDLCGRVGERHSKLCPQRSKRQTTLKTRVPHHHTEGHERGDAESGSSLESEERRPDQAQCHSAVLGPAGQVPDAVEDEDQRLSERVDRCEAVVTERREHRLERRCKPLKVSSSRLKDDPRLLIEVVTSCVSVLRQRHRVSVRLKA